MTTIVNMDIGYNWKKWRLAVELFNILDAKANDIVYFYESRPPGLPAMEDYHFHPVVPSSVRASLQCIF